ncbi:hypothetical protein EDD52_1029 [Primorskyibacter sedentarius]|uniref:Uncharacterized protein n=1 Tax=Primorskyibacter sedentarius TaxID=745311 RepID=A0A4R3JME2_9RHOB|nr:orotidine 5-phosphate decarboxylase [Primorskyibacter sedentarius]TCS66195.1 hypothetical protein EDD52_1029 [Primorskyibacter sedentarius]
MQNPLAQISDVTYNAASQCFEALVTLHVGKTLVHVASAFHAPMNTSYRIITGGLTRVALRDLVRGNAMLSRRSAHAHTSSVTPQPRWKTQLSGRRAS